MGDAGTETTTLHSQRLHDIDQEVRALNLGLDRCLAEEHALHEQIETERPRFARIRGAVDTVHARTHTTYDRLQTDRLRLHAMILDNIETLDNVQKSGSYASFIIRKSTELHVMDQEIGRICADIERECTLFIQANQL
jgi:hypothetical protein